MMQEQQAHNPPLSSLHPLQGDGRSREAVVERQIMRLLAAAPNELRHFLQNTDRETPDFVQEETLVYLLRHKIRCGDTQAAGDIAEQLSERSAGFILRLVAVWKSLSDSQREDCIADVTSQMWLDLFNLSASCEFWEIRFWLCLRRRTLNCIQKYRVLNENEYQPPPVADNEGQETDALERIPASERFSPELQALLKDALEALPDKERKVFVLYHLHQWTQDQIAERLDMTDRTVRNVLGRVDKRLAEWRAGIQGTR
jgi:RNA polymerase sigma factor (sigma-70 family)